MKLFQNIKFNKEGLAILRDVSGPIVPKANSVAPYRSYSSTARISIAKKKEEKHSYLGHF